MIKYFDSCQQMVMGGGYIPQEAINILNMSVLSKYRFLLQYQLSASVDEYSQIYYLITPIQCIKKKSSQKVRKSLFVLFQF